MDATAILNKIQADAKDAAAAILRDAREKAAAQTRAAEERVETARERARKQAAADAEGATARMTRMAELEERKLLLADKRQMISRAFDMALAGMEAMDAAEAQRFLVAVIAEVADGDEMVIPGAQHCTWLDDGFLAKANSALQAAGKPGKLKLSAEKREGVSGLVLQKGETETNCSYAALLESSRLQLEASVAAILFPED